MCLIAFAYDSHPDYDLIFAANRDEYYGRPTRKAQFWDEEPHILAGKDLKAGGTWMGVTKNGYFSALTNYRDPSEVKEEAPSRGQLPLNFLKQEMDPEEYLFQLKKHAKKYNGFNLLAGTPDKICYYSNRRGSVQVLQPGIFGLSNHLLNTSWPKVNKAKKDLQTIIKKDNISEETLFEMLTNDTPAPENQLPDTGLSKDLEKAVSPVFIKTEKYGTRCSSILIIKKNGEVTFVERRFKPGTTDPEGTSRLNFAIPK